MNAQEAQANYEKQKTWYREQMNKTIATVKSADGCRYGKTDYVTFKRQGWRAQFFTDNGKEVVWHTISGYASRGETQSKVFAAVNATLGYQQN